MSKFKSVILFFMIFTACNRDKDSTKNKDMANNNKYVHNGNSSIDVSVRDLNGKSTILFATNDGIIIGLNNQPFALFASSDFKLSELPLTLSNKISSLSRILLQSELNKKNIKEPKSTPDWLLKFTTVDYLSLNEVKISSVQTLNLPKLKYLILNDVSFENRAVIISGFNILKSLKYLAHNDIFTPSEIALIKKSSPNISVLSECEFNKKVKDGDIVIN